MFSRKGDCPGKTISSISPRKGETLRSAVRGGIAYTALISMSSATVS